MLLAERCQSNHWIFLISYASVEATKHERGRPTGGLTIAVHQKIMNQCEIVSKSRLSVIFRVVKTPLLFIMAYFNHEIAEDDRGDHL